MTIPTMRKDNICCPDLQVVPCDDTDEHCHLICGFSKEIIANQTVIDLCMSDFTKCVLRGER